MPIPKGLSKSPFEINHPDDRWRTDLDPIKDNIQKHYAPLVKKIREEIYDWRQFGYPDIYDTSRELLNFWFCTEHACQFKY